MGFEPDSKCCILQSLYNNEIIRDFRNSGIFGFMKIYMYTITLKAVSDLRGFEPLPSSGTPLD